MKGVRFRAIAGSSLAAVLAFAVLPARAAEEDTAEAGAEAGGASRPLRDPFRPFTLELRPKKSGTPKTPLQQYDVSALTLVAIIWGSNPKAMVEDATGLGYTIGIGTPIGTAGGVVRTIEPERVIIEEEFVDFYGEKKKTETVLKLKTEGEKRP